jgi:TatD DNase family protein
MMLVDTHCHLYLKHFKNDLDANIQRCLDNGIEKIFLPAIDSETHNDLIELSEYSVRNPDSKIGIYPMMGVHPCSVNEKFEEELAIALQHLDSGRKYYAVGEIGLDYYWDMTYQPQQKVAFERQIEWSIERNLPIVIHSRKSTQDCIDVVKKFNGKAKGIFHCFSGTVEEAKQIIDLGLYLGIGGVVTYKNGGLKEVVQQLSLDHLVLETDAPYLSPVPHRGKRNEPSYIKYIAETVADATGKTLTQVAEATTKNALSVFQMN